MMTKEQLQEALKSAAQAGAAKAIELHAAAIRSGASSTHVAVKTQKQHSPTMIAGFVVAMLSPIGGGIAWVNSLSSRVSVVESSQQAITTKLADVDSLNTELPAVQRYSSSSKTLLGRCATGSGRTVSAHPKAERRSY